MLYKKLLMYVVPVLIVSGVSLWVHFRKHAEPAPAPVVTPAPDEPAPGDQPAQPQQTPDEPAIKPPVFLTPNTPPSLTSTEPSLEEQALLEEAQSFSKSPFWARCLAQTAPVKRFVQAIDAIANGQRPTAPLDFLKPAAAFSAEKTAQGECIPSPAAYARYQEIVDFVRARYPQTLAEWYRKAEPALQKACQDLGYQNTTIRELVTKACTTILSTPQFDFNPSLVPAGQPGLFRYQDPAFEKLNDAQKLLVRLGPKNSARLRAQCDAVASALHLFRN